MAAEKEPNEKIFCIFHQKTDCTCIYPVVAQNVLIERLKHHIRLNEILNKHEKNQETKDKRDRETILYENRLADLKD